MSNQEQESTTTETYENPTSVNNEQTEISNENPQSNTKISVEQETTRQIKMPQDIRYSTEQGDRDKLIKKYEDYQVSDTNSCNIRFLIDQRQKRNLLGRHEEENSNLQSIGQTFHVNILSAYQNPPKHSYKMFGTEMNIRQCLIEILNRIFKQQTRSSIQPKSTIENEQTQETESSEQTETSVTISSTTEEKPPLTPTKTNLNEENTEEEQYKFVPLELKPEYTFILLITSQGQEVLKKNWNFFAGSLQQRLNVTVTNPFRLHKFGDKQSLYELSITGHAHENITDAALQITAFINDVLGVPTQPYKGDEEQVNSENNQYQRPRNSNPTDSHYQQQRRYEPNNNRNRNGIYEQLILIRGDCVPRIVGTRGSNMRRIQSKCHLLEMNIARQPNENGYTECKLSAYQTRNLNFAIDTIRNYLRNENDQVLQIFDSYYVDLPLQSSSYQNDHLQISNQNQEYFSQQSTLAFNPSSQLNHTMNETGFITTSLHYNTGIIQYPPSSYTFQNTPSFDFTHRPTFASRKNDKRPGDIHCSNNGDTRTSNENSDQQNDGASSSSSNSCSVSPHHKSKRTCPETKEIDCTTDDGFWIQKQYYYALDDQSKELFDSLLDKLEQIRIGNEENAARKQQRFIERTRGSKSRTFLSSTTQSNNGNDLITNVDEEKKTNSTEEKDLTSTEQEPTSI